MINFHKMHGLGNDFMIVENIELPIEQIIALADRHTGVGFDQLLSIKYTDSLPEVEVFNADGSKASFCGNGFRCLTGLLLEFEPGNVQFKTVSGTINGEFNEDGTASICMANKPEIIKQNFKTLDTIYYVDVGNKHLVCVENGDKKFDDIYQTCLKEYGSDINIFNVLESSEKEANILCYERGVGLTQACGSGAYAVYSVLNKNYNASDDFTVHMPGGSLFMYKKDGFTLQAGPIVYVYAGVA